MAQAFKTAVLSADSRQCYKELNIGVARPSIDELNTVPHYFIASRNISTTLTAADYEVYALTLLNELFDKTNVVVLCGGTGLYIKALLQGLDSIPPVSVSARKKVMAGYNQYGLLWLQQQLAVKDTRFFAEGEIKNPQRCMRALEVVESTGKSILSFHKSMPVERPFKAIEIGLELPRKVLIDRIDKRVDVMIKEGLIDEVKSLLPYQHFNALQTVGYKEVFEYMNGDSTLAQCVENIKIHTRQYAKRQMTWFKKDGNVKWFSPFEEKTILEYCTQIMD